MAMPTRPDDFKNAIMNCDGGTKNVGAKNAKKEEVVDKQNDLMFLIKFNDLSKKFNVRFWKFSELGDLKSQVLNPLNDYRKANKFFMVI